MTSLPCVSLIDIFFFVASFEMTSLITERVDKLSDLNSASFCL